MSFFKIILRRKTLILELLTVAALTSPLLSAAEESACHGLAVQKCQATKGCVLDCEVEKDHHCSPYICRDAKNSCESSVEQGSLTKEKCEDMPDCRYSQASCFCPGPSECYCGGGPPPRCSQK